MNSPGVHAPHTPSSSRKRHREDETEAQRIKREKAAERQRRKREKDRNNAGLAMLQGYAAAAAAASASAPPTVLPDGDSKAQQSQPQPPATPQQQEYQPQPQPTPQPQPQPIQQTPQQQPVQPPELTPEEQARRERVRAAARERQRKHRAHVKQRKLRELGMDMGNEVPPAAPPAGQDPNLAEIYRIPEGYAMLPPHDMQMVHPPDGQPPTHFPQPPLSPAQAFASTILLSFSCAPMLKGHLLRTLNMSNDELASLEPYIAEAWDRWDAERRRRFAEQSGKPASSAPAPSGTTANPPAPFPIMPELQYDPSQVTNEFRQRFGRAMEVPPPPFPFAPEAPAAAGGTPSSASGSGDSVSVDPHLGGAGQSGKGS